MNERKRTVALIDDDPRVLDSLENLFKSAGYEIRKFSSANSLIDAEWSDVDCLITDIGMPSLDGFALHDLVKKTRPDLPVFLITGRDIGGDQERALVSGVSGFFRKPFDGPALLGAVDDALDLKSE